MDCILCVEKIELIARYACSHTICYKCATKLIFLYNNNKCPLCKSTKGKLKFENLANEHRNNEKVNISEGNDKSCKIEDKYAVYDNSATFKKIKGLLLKKCTKCKIVVESNKELINHYKIKHSVLICDTCINNGHEFWYEHTNYKAENLIKHQNGKLNQPGFTGHIYCTHCEKYLYDHDKAKHHARNTHQLCTVCEILGIKNQFYKDYAALEIHYRAKHFLCDNSSCIKNHSYVFAYQSELWKHAKSVHSICLNLASIKSSLCEDPPVLSLIVNNVAESEDNITSKMNLLVNIPYFPSFGKVYTGSSDETNSMNKMVVKNTLKETRNVPEYMDRRILFEENKMSRTRICQLKLLTNIFVEEINEAIAKYIDGTKSINDMVKEIELGVGNKKCLNILRNISFLHKNKEVKEFLVDYTTKVIFPKFQKEEKDTNIKAQFNKNRFIKDFRVLDLSKKK